MANESTVAAKTKKCERCGLESKALHLHMKKHEKEDAENKSADIKIEEQTGLTPAVKGENKESEVTRAEFNQLALGVGQITEMMGKVLQGFENLKSTPQVASINAESSFKTPEISGEPEKNFVPPKWRELVKSQLGEKIGVSVVYPDTGSGFLFKLHIPREISNAPKDHWDFYKHDTRTKAIGYSEGIDGIKKFVKLVKGDLSRSKQNEIE